MLRLSDVRDWSGQVLTKAREIFFRRKVQPVVFVYPAQGTETQSKIVPANDGTYLLAQANVATVPLNSALHGSWAKAGNSGLTIDATGRIVEVLTAVYEEETGAGVVGLELSYTDDTGTYAVAPSTDVAANKAGDLTGGKSIVFITTPGSAVSTLSVVNGVATDDWYFSYRYWSTGY